LGTAERIVANIRTKGPNIRKTKRVQKKKKKERKKKKRTAALQKAGSDGREKGNMEIKGPARKTYLSKKSGRVSFHRWEGNQR